MTHLTFFFVNNEFVTSTLVTGGKEEEEKKTGHMDSLIERVVSHRVRMSSLSVVTLLWHRHAHVGFGMMTLLGTGKSTVTLICN